jgi:hypothetical protein
MQESKMMRIYNDRVRWSSATAYVGRNYVKSERKKLPLSIVQV